MSEALPELQKKLSLLIQTGFRGRLNARGAARAMVWRDGVMPVDGPPLGERLTEELLSYGFGLLGVALRARDLGEESDSLSRAFELAAESLESVVRNGSSLDEGRGFYRVVASASYHLGKFSARAYSLASQELDQQNLSIIERALSLLILRKIEDLNCLLLREIGDPKNSDETILKRLDDFEDQFNSDDALLTSVTDNYLRTLAMFVFAIRTNDGALFVHVKERLQEGELVCSEMAFVAVWWIYRLSRLLLADLWALSLHQLLPIEIAGVPEWRRLRDIFIGSLIQRNIAEIDLWPSQVGVIPRISDAGDDIVVSLPTSAGKTRVAELCILRALSQGQRVFFVTPLRSLSAQTERALKKTFSPLGFEVSSLYGSAGVSVFDLDNLSGQHIVVATPEKLDFALRNDPDLLNDVGLIVLDEGHMLGPTEREIRYEVLVQRLIKRPDSNNRRLVCLSAMLPSGQELDDFVNWIRDDAPGGPLYSVWRPTRQRFGHITWSGGTARYELSIEDEKTFIHGFIKQQEIVGPKGGVKRFPSDQKELVIACAYRLVEEGFSILVYCPEKKSVNALAKQILIAYKRGFLKDLEGFDPSVVQRALEVGKEWLGEGHFVLHCLSLGVAIHHADLPRPFIRELDELIREKKLKIVIASPTLSRGLNISASCVLFHGVERFNRSTGLRETISVEEFSNVAGRAGRAYVDLDGQVLGVCFSGDQLSKWQSLIKQKAERKLESGFLKLIILLLRGMQTKVGNRADLLEYILNNNDIWDEKNIVESELVSWRNSLVVLDIAILSLIGDESCDVDNVAEVLDKVLSSSLFHKRIERIKEESRKLIQSIISARAKYICSVTSAKQRRGYFFSGVGLATGQFLDKHAEELNNAVLEADKALKIGDGGRCIEEVIKIAECVFETDAFSPSLKPGNWKDVVSAWLRGVPMADIQRICENASTFIESALVYRLVWAIEAIRNRSRANEEQVFSDDPCFISAAIETGTVSLTQALLIQFGLGSRVAAMRALNDFPADFRNLNGLRDWLFSDSIQKATQDPNWPSPESHQSWLEFVDSHQPTARLKWGVKEFDAECSFLGSIEELRVGDPVLIWQVNPGESMRIFTPELVEIGRVNQTFKEWATHWATGHIKGENLITMRYVGPFMVQ